MKRRWLGTFLVTLAALLAFLGLCASDPASQPTGALVVARTLAPLSLSTPLSATQSYTSYLPLVASRLDDYQKTYFPLIYHGYSPLRPDFVITHVSFDAPQIVAGQPFPLSVTVHNQGAGDTAHYGVPAWFVIEAYIKLHGFEPTGPPAGPLDHAGGFCSDDSVNCATGTEHPEHVAAIDGLDPDESQITGFTLTFPQAGIYDVYFQVDTTWEALGYTGKPWGQHPEEDESNNIIAIESFFVPASH